MNPQTDPENLFLGKATLSTRGFSQVLGLENRSQLTSLETLCSRCSFYRCSLKTSPLNASQHGVIKDELSIGMRDILHQPISTKNQKDWVMIWSVSHLSFWRLSERIQQAIELGNHDMCSCAYLQLQDHGHRSLLRLLIDFDQIPQRQERHRPRNRTLPRPGCLSACAYCEWTLSLAGPEN